jgi:hypothetical protein
MDLKQKFLDHLRGTASTEKKGGTRKIGDLRERPCRHPEHDPHGMRVFDDGVYEHTCPACGSTGRFMVAHPML